eukprot:scaffold4063_cov178-Amphora_coffeaeformis.AAC.2
MKLIHPRAQQLAVVNNGKRLADDEGSVSSTFTVERQLNQKLITGNASSSSNAAETKKSSSVKFNLSRNIEYSSPVITEEMSITQWYSKDEYKKFKSSFIGLAREFQKYDKANNGPESFGVLLRRTFEACCDATEDMKSCLLDPQEEKLLKQWFDKCSRRGLERVSVPRIFADKSARRKAINNAVLNTEYNTRNMDDLEERAESIRQASEEVSRASRMFAWRLAN